jgi:hypothetical protein
MQSQPGMLPGLFGFSFNPNLAHEVPLLPRSVRIGKRRPLH